MQNPMFIIFGAVIVVIILQVLTVIITKYFVGGIKREIEGLKHIFQQENLSQINCIKCEVEEPNEERECSSVEDIPVTEKAEPFDFIKSYDPSHFLNFIQGEHPQTIALILSYLDPSKASIILSELPHNVQADVSRRIAEMHRVNTKVLSIIERVIKRKFEHFANDFSFSVRGGIDSVVDILHLVDRGTEKIIIEALEEEDPELAEEIKKRMFVFEDIILLDDRAIQKVLRETDGQILCQALKGVEKDVQDKIFRNCSERAAALLKEDMNFMGPIRLSDVEDAQQTIINIIRKLEDSGEIRVNRLEEQMPTWTE